jgi:hypothetical protein
MLRGQVKEVQAGYKILSLQRGGVFSGWEKSSPDYCALSAENVVHDERHVGGLRQRERNVGRT